LEDNECCRKALLEEVKEAPLTLFSKATMSGLAALLSETPEFPSGFVLELLTRSSKFREEKLGSMETFRSI
jgi:hypothetical protein